MLFFFRDPGNRTVPEGTISLYLPQTGKVIGPTIPEEDLLKAQEQWR